MQKIGGFIENKLQPYELTIFNNIKIDFLNTIQGKSEKGYRKKGFAGIQKRHGSYHECFTSGQVIKRVYHIIISQQNFFESIIKPSIQAKPRTIKNAYKTFLGLEGCQTGVEALLGDSWLTDEIIGFYLEMLSDERRNVYSLPFWTIQFDGTIAAFKRKYDSHRKD